MTLSELGREWLRQRQAEKPYSFAARADRAHPEKADLYGVNRSCILEGVRVYLFEVERSHDAFVKAYNGSVVPLPVL